MKEAKKLERDIEKSKPKTHRNRIEKHKSITDQCLEKPIFKKSNKNFKKKLETRLRHIKSSIPENPHETLTNISIVPTKRIVNSSSQSSHLK
jgi:hypothetical protein